MLHMFYYIDICIGYNGKIIPLFVFIATLLICQGQFVILFSDFRTKVYSIYSFISMHLIKYTYFIIDDRALLLSLDNLLWYH